MCQCYETQAIVAKGFTDGGKGMTELAKQLVKLVEENTGSFKPLYSFEQSPEDKITAIATKIYGAEGVEFSVKAKSQLQQIKSFGFDNFPICMAKTPASFSDNEKLIGRPTNFDITVREFEIASGAGFIVPLLGEVMRMPGLPAVPNAERIDIDNNGVITGLS